MLQIRVYFMLVVGCPLPVAVLGWSLTRRDHTMSFTTSTAVPLTVQCLCAQHWTVSPTSPKHASLALELWSSSQIPTQAAWERNILKTINDHVLLLLRVSVGVPAPRWEFYSGDLYKQTRSVQTPVSVCFALGVWTSCISTCNCQSNSPDAIHVLKGQKAFRHFLIPEKVEKLSEGDLLFNMLLLFRGFLMLKARSDAYLAALSSVKMLYYGVVRQPWRGLSTWEILLTWLLWLSELCWCSKRDGRYDHILYVIP